MSESRQKVTVSLQACIENVGISPKSDSFFAGVYRKCRNLAQKRQFLYSSVKKMSEQTPANVPQNGRSTRATDITYSLTATLVFALAGTRTHKACLSTLNRKCFV